MAKRKRRRFARLSPYEDKCWVFAFCYHLDVSKQGDAEAGRRTWRDMCLEFPRLRYFVGCQ